MLRNHRHIGAFLFTSEEIAPADWANAEHVEVVGRYFEDRQLHRIAQAGERGRESVLRGEAGENALTIAIEQEARRAEGQVDLVTQASLIAGQNVHDALRLGKRQAAQKQVVRLGIFRP